MDKMALGAIDSAGGRRLEVDFITPCGRFEDFKTHSRGCILITIVVCPQSLPVPSLDSIEILTWCRSYRSDVLLVYFPRLGLG
jgi:hypothetical protein